MSDLPKGWVKATLNQIAFPDRPRHLPTSHPQLPFIGMEHVEAHSMRLLGTVPSGGLKSSAVHFQNGDVLYGRLRPYLNKVLVASCEGLCSAEFIVFANHGGVNSAWLAYFLNSSEFVSFASHLNTGDRPRVDFDQLGPYQILFAPRPEQDRIVAEIEKQFTRLDAATTALKRVQANLKRYRASVLKAACEGRLVPTEAELARKEGRDYESADKLLQRILRERRTRWEADTLAKMIASNNPPKDDSWKQKYKEPSAPDTTNLPTVPEGWCWIRIGHAFDCIVPNRDKPESFTGDIPWLTLPDFGVEIEVQKSKNERGLSQSEVERYNARLIPAGSVVMSCVGRFGVTAVLKCVAVINQQLHAFILPKWLPGHFYAYALRTQTNYMESLSTATTIAYLNKDNCNSVPVPMPPALEQRRIYQELDRQMSVVAELEKQAERSLKLARNLRQSILKHAFSGNLAPQDSTDEPASVLLERIRAGRSSADPKKSDPRNSRQHAYSGTALSGAQE